MGKKNIWATGIAALAVVVGAVLLPGAAEAKIVSGNHGSSASSAGVVDEDLFITGSNVKVQGTVNGDVYAAGQNVEIDATVTGDVFAAGQTVSVSGRAYGVRAAGQTVRLEGLTLTGGATAMGQTVSLDSRSSVGGGLTFAGQTVTVSAPVTSGVTGAGHDVKLDAAVGRSANVAADKLVLGSAASIAGNLSYQSGNAVSKDASAVVRGRTDRTQPPHHERRPEQNPWRARLLTQLWAFTASLLIGLLLFWLARRPLSRVATAVERRPATALGLGVLAMLVIGPAFILLCITIIGIPLAFITVAAYAVLLYLAKLFVALAVARAWAKPMGLEEVPVVFRFAVALAVFYLLALVPLFGAVTGLAVVWLGSGGALATLVAGSRHSGTEPAV